MFYRSTIIASLSAIALVLAVGESSANPPIGAPAPAAAPGGPGMAPGRPGFPSFPSGHHHRGVGTGFFPGGGYFGSVAAEEPAPAPPVILKQSDDLRYTCVLDIPWDYVHRCPQYNR